MPVQQATGETQPTEPYSILCDTPNSHGGSHADIRHRMQIRVWREQDAMRQCRNGFGVIPRSFGDEKESSPPHCGQQH
jgi:hypothetical protein